MATDIEIRPLRYNTVAASQTAQVLKKQADTVAGTIAGTGAREDILESLLIIPATTSPGAVAILDGTTSINVFPGGAGSVLTLIPFLVPIGARSINGPWSVTTGANVSVVASGRFT